jgi:hypothetical protein
MKLRLEGTSAECEQAACQIAEVLDVVSISDPYPNRGRSQLIRVYLEIRLDPEDAPSDAAEPDQPLDRGPTFAGSTGSCMVSAIDQLVVDGFPLAHRTVDRGHGRIECPSIQTARYPSR